MVAVALPLLEEEPLDAPPSPPRLAAALSLDTAAAGVWLLLGEVAPLPDDVRLLHAVVAVAVPHALDGQPRPQIRGLVMVAEVVGTVGVILVGAALPALEFIPAVLAEVRRAGLASAPEIPIAGGGGVRPPVALPRAVATLGEGAVPDVIGRLQVNDGLVGAPIRSGAVDVVTLLLAVGVLEGPADVVVLRLVAGPAEPSHTASQLVAVAGVGTRDARCLEAVHRIHAGATGPLLDAVSRVGALPIPPPHLRMLLPPLPAVGLLGHSLVMGVLLLTRPRETVGEVHEGRAHAHARPPPRLVAPL